MLLVGYIKPNTTAGTIEGVNGKLTIKAYLDKNKILISDTYDGTESDNMGTTNSMARGKTVLTTTEWNALSTGGVSFQIKVEANEGIWVKGSLEEIMKQENFDTTKNRGILDNEQSEFVTLSTGINFGAVSSDTNGKGVYMRAGTENDTYPILYYRGDVTNNNVIFNNKCWKAVRTTDTGGVKLIYNGELKGIFEDGDNIELSGYTNVNKVIDVVDASESFTFDSSDSTWNITLMGATNTEFEFTVPNGDNYNLVMTGTSGSSCGGTMTFYKDGTSVNGGLQGGGNAMNLSYSYGSLTSSNKIKMTFNGSSSTTCPITFKIKMEQESQALSNNQYTIITNDIVVESQKWTFDENEKEWYAIVPNGSSIKISFGIAKNGNYGIKYTATGGPISIKKGDNVISSSNGTDTIISLGAVLTSDEYSIEYRQLSTGSGRIEFALIEQNEVGMGCENTGTDTYINIAGTRTFSFNTNCNSPAYVGYMYGDVYAYNFGATTSGTYYGSGFTYDGTNYTLVDPVTTKNNTHHYTCNLTTAEGTCTTIRYYYYGNYYVNLTGGDSIERAMEKMQINTNNSNAKTQIDSWYFSNMNTATNKLEDTIWCNDRSIGNGNNNGWIANGGDLNTYLYYGSKERSNHASNTSIVKNRPSLACTNKNDAFTVSNGNGNQKLTYPVALLTEDEMVLAGGLVGMANTFYLNNGSTYYWSLSPSGSLDDSTSEFIKDMDGSIGYYSVNSSSGLRPAISLKPGLPVIQGTGTVLDPYVVE